MLYQFKKLVKNNESDIILVISIVLVALISFGAGLLVDFSENEGSIIIQQPTASIQQSLIDSSEIPVEQKSEQGKFVGSINSNKYHWPDCSFAKRIAEENQIWFSSEEEAKSAGYIRCGSFDKYIK